MSGAVTGAIAGTACHFLHNAIKPAKTVAVMREELGLLIKTQEEAAASSQAPTNLQAVRPEERWEAWQKSRAAQSSNE